MKDGLSIIVPCYGMDGRFIEETIASVYTQREAPPFEVIIVNDGSSEPVTLSALDRINRAHPDIRIIEHKINSGLPTARNTGLENASYPFIFPLDSDDKLSTDPALMQGGGYLGRAVDALKTNPDVVFSYCGLKLFGAVNHVWKRPVFDEKRLLSNHHIGPFAIYRKDEALSMGGYNTGLGYAEDCDFNIALINQRIKAGKPAQVEFFPEPYFHYRRRPDNSSMTSSRPGWTRDVFEKIIARSPEIYEKHFPGMSGDQLIDHVMERRREGLRSEASELFLRCARHPVDSLRDGTAEFTAYTVKRKVRVGLAALWGSKNDTPGSDETAGQEMLAGINRHTHEINPL